MSRFTAFYALRLRVTEKPWQGLHSRVDCYKKSGSGRTFQSTCTKLLASIMVRTHAAPLRKAKSHLVTGISAMAARIQPGVERLIDGRPLLSPKSICSGGQSSAKNEQVAYCPRDVSAQLVVRLPDADPARRRSRPYGRSVSMWAKDSEPAHGARQVWLIC